MTLQINMKLNEQQSARHNNNNFRSKKQHQRSLNSDEDVAVVDDVGSITSSASSSTNQQRHHHHRHHHQVTSSNGDDASTHGSFYDNDITAASRATSSGSMMKLPDLTAIVDTVTAVRSSFHGSGRSSSSLSSPNCSELPTEEPQRAAATQAAPAAVVEDTSTNIDEEWAKIANIMSSVQHDVSDGMSSNSTYAKEFEQTFYKLMTGKHQNSIQGWLHDVGMEQYEQVLVGNGFDNVEFLAGGILEEQDLLDMEIIDYNHRRTILNSCAGLPPLSPVPSTWTLEKWLNSLQLREVAGDKFAEIGCNDIMDVSDLERNKLHEILKKRGHMKRVVASLNTFLNISTSLEHLTIPDASQVDEAKVLTSRTSSNNTATRADLTSKHKKEELSAAAATSEASSGRRHRRNRRRPSQPEAINYEAAAASPYKTSPVLSSSRSQQTSEAQNMNADNSSTSTTAPVLPDMQRAVYLASAASSGSSLNLRPPNETTEEVSVSAWRHQPQQLISSKCTYQAQYLGSMLITELKGPESTIEACSKMKKSTTQMKKMPLITLAISYSGVKFIDFESKHEIAEHDITNISFASQDAEDLQMFAYITHDIRTSKHYCHVFRVSTLDTAYEIILTIGQSFEIAYQLVRKEAALQQQ